MYRVIDSVPGFADEDNITVDSEIEVLEGDKMETKLWTPEKELVLVIETVDWILERIRDEVKETLTVIDCPAGGTDDSETDVLVTNRVEDELI